MSSREQLLNELTTKHPEACQLMAQLVQAIDLEKRSLPTCAQDVRNNFCLSDLDDWVSTTLDSLSSSDATPVEADHAFRVIYAFFVDLDSKGFSLKSVPTDSDVRIDSSDILGLRQALDELEDDENNKLWNISVSLFDLNEDPCTPFVFRSVAVAADTLGLAYSMAESFATDNIDMTGGTSFKAIDAEVLNPDDYR
jgi:hypothetical protein